MQGSRSLERSSAELEASCAGCCSMARSSAAMRAAFGAEI